MNTTEFKEGQQWRVINANGFNEGVGERYSEVRDGDLLIAIEKSSISSGIWEMRIVNSASVTLADYMDIQDKYIVLSEESTEASEDVSPAWATSVPEGVENVSQESIGTSQEILDAAHTCVGVSRSSVDSSEGVRMYKQEKPMDNSKDILWHIISRAERYNGHSQFTVSEMDLSTLITLTRMLDDYVEEFCEMRLSWGGDHMGYYTADIYEIASARDDSKDKILMQIEKVTGI